MIEDNQSGITGCSAGAVVVAGIGAASWMGAVKIRCSASGAGAVVLVITGFSGAGVGFWVAISPVFDRDIGITTPALNGSPSQYRGK